MEPVYSHEIWL